MRPIAICALAVALAAGEADPAARVPADAALDVRLPDLARSRTRWAASPYARLAATAWGQVTIGELRLRLERAAPGASAALDALRSAAIGLEPGDPAPRIHAAAIGDIGAIRLALGGFAGVPPAGDGEWPLAGGRLALAGGIVAWSNGVLAHPVARPAAPPADADLVLRLAPQRWRAVAGDAAALLPVLPRELAVTVSLDPVGLRERVVTPADPTQAVVAAGWKGWADPAELTALPATTLGAITGDGAGLARLLGGADGLDAQCLAAGLPGWQETLRGLDGPCTAWIAEGMPFPTATIALALPEALARRWIDAAGAKLNLAAPAADGSRSGYVGLLPLAIGWVPGEAGHGRLVLTSDPQGLDIWRKRTPGFAALPAVKESPAVPPRCVVLGAGRGGPGWATLAQLVVPVFAGMGNPHVVALPTDLRAAAGRGWLYATLRADGGWDVDSGGLFGGPVCVAGLVMTAVPAVMWVQHEMTREQRPVKPEPPPPAPKVF